MYMASYSKGRLADYAAGLDTLPLVDTQTLTNKNAACNIYIYILSDIMNNV